MRCRTLVLSCFLLSCFCTGEAVYAQNKLIVNSKLSTLIDFFRSKPFSLGIPIASSDEEVESMGPKSEILLLKEDEINILPSVLKGYYNVCLLLNNRIFSKKQAIGGKYFGQHARYVGYKIKLYYPKSSKKVEGKQVSILRNGSFETNFKYHPSLTLKDFGEKFDSYHEKDIPGIIRVDIQNKAANLNLGLDWHSTPRANTHNKKPQRSTWDDRKKWIYGAEDAATIRDTDILKVIAESYRQPQLFRSIAQKNLAKEIDHEFIAWPVAFVPTTQEANVLARPRGEEGNTTGKRVTICAPWSDAVLVHITAFVTETGESETDNEKKYLIVIKPNDKLLLRGMLNNVN